MTLAGRRQTLDDLAGDGGRGVDYGGRRRRGVTLAGRRLTLE